MPVDLCPDRFSEYPQGEVVLIDMSDIPLEVVVDVVRFVYTTELEVTPKTVGPMMKCAEELGLDAVIKLCEEFLDAVTADTAIFYYSIAENYNLAAALRDRIYLFILENFVEIAQSKHFLYMPLDRVRCLLTDDRLRVGSEMEVFVVLMRWLNFDREERMPAAAGLMREAVRMQHISPECLVKDVESVDWIFGDAECQAVLNDAIR